jgi:GTP-binding protein
MRSGSQDARRAFAGRKLKCFTVPVRSAPTADFVNDPKLMHFSYLRFLENRIREEYSYLGTPIRIVVKSRRED